VALQLDGVVDIYFKIAGSYPTIITLCNIGGVLLRHNKVQGMWEVK